MKLSHRLITVFGGVLLLGLMVGSVNADPWNKKTFFTFNRGIELPGGMVLPAGKYTFRMADTWDRHIVQVLTGDEKKLLASVMTITAPHRRDASESSTITFGEAAPTAPQPLKYWYYVGEYAGHEFVYPKEQLARIAREMHGQVTTVASASEINTEPAPALTESQEQADVTTVEPTETTGTTAVEETTLAESAPAVPYVSQSNEPRPVGTSGSAQLPRTASFDPLVGFIGLMSFGGFVATRIRPR